MSLSSEFPTIDDRTYSDIVDEARARIQRYTPEWTDVNESDPGMTMVELFAWLTEMQIYRLGKVPELNYLKFLELIGIELNTAKPASAQLFFPIEDDYTDSYVVIPARTQVSTEEPDEDGDIIFETDHSLIALTAKMDAVMLSDSSHVRDVSIENEAADVSFSPFGKGASVGNAVYLGFVPTLTFPAVSFTLTFWSARDNSGSALECNGAVSINRSQVQWEYWDGREWRGMVQLKDSTGGLEVSGELVLQLPVDEEFVALELSPVDGERYWLRGRLLAADYQQSPMLYAVRSNTVSATQAATIAGEVVGGSDGQPDQLFYLNDKPILDGSLKLTIDEGLSDQQEQWLEVDDFFSSGQNDAHYVLNRSSGEIRFGGVGKRVPLANPNKRVNILAEEYRVGGGSRGNVGAGEINNLLSQVKGVESAAIGNLFSASGGTDEETLEQAKLRAPLALKARDRAVTAEDYELLAKQAANIARAHALPLYHPDFPGVEVPGVVSVVVVPDIKGIAPVPTAGTLAAVRCYLDQRRTLTSELYVLKPVYRTVTVEAEVIAENDADLAELTERLLQTLNDYLHPLKGGEEGCGWKFGGDIYYARLLHRMMVSGVFRLGQVKITLDGELQKACTDICIDAHALLKSGQHQINVDYDYSGGV
ncbi:MAG: putative baseplate assembly protein [Arenicellales bacterium]